MSDGRRTSIAKGRNARALLGVADIPLTVLAGFALFFLASYLSLSWAGIMPVSLRRIANIGPFLQAKAGEAQENNMFVFGSSIVVEGIDCDILDAQLPSSYRSFNLGWTGGELRQAALAIPNAMRARPAAVVLCVWPGELLLSTTVSAERVAMAGWSGLAQPEDGADLAEVLDPEEVKPLSDSVFTHLLRFRSLPLGALNSNLREAARSDLRYDDYATNFRSPWAMRDRVNPAAFDRHMAGFLEGCDTYDMTKLPANAEKFSRLLRWTLRRVRGGNSKAIVVVVPHHPILLDRLKKTGLWQPGFDPIKNICEQENAALLDHSEVIGADDFADAVHPREPGRATWSRALGRAIAEQIK